MENVFQKYITDLDQLSKIGEQLWHNMTKECDLIDSANNGPKNEIPYPLDFRNNYEQWYTEARALISQIIPERLDDFQRLYKIEKRKELTHATYTISDYLIGLVGKKFGESTVDGKSALPKFQQQRGILASAKKKFESSLFDLEQSIQIDLFDCELTSARELNKKGFHRSAGVIAGLVLQKHLSHICRYRKIKLPKKKLSLSDYNDKLKESDMYKTVKWRKIQNLSDLKNLCDLKNKKTPEFEEVEELVDETEKIIKNLW